MFLQITDLSRKNCNSSLIPTKIEGQGKLYLDNPVIKLKELPKSYAKMSKGLTLISNSTNYTEILVSLQALSDDGNKLEECIKCHSKKKAKNWSEWLKQQFPNEKYPPFFVLTKNGEKTMMLNDNPVFYVAFICTPCSHNSTRSNDLTLRITLKDIKTNEEYISDTQIPFKKNQKRNGKKAKGQLDPSLGQLPSPNFNQPQYCLPFSWQLYVQQSLYPIQTQYYPYVQQSPYPIRGDLRPLLFPEDCPVEYLPVEGTSQTTPQSEIANVNVVEHSSPKLEVPWEYSIFDSVVELANID